MSIFSKKDNHPAGCLVMVSVADTVAEKFGAIVTLDNEKSAVRAFRDIVRNKGSVTGQHPADFNLVIIGYFDPSSGKIYNTKSGEPEIVISGFEANAVNEFEGVPTIENTVKEKENEEVFHEVSATE